MPRVQRNFWTDARLVRVTVTLAIALALAIVGALTQPEARSGMLLRGDFPGFYAPAKIIAEGQGRQLYDPMLQREIENRYWPEMQGNVLVSVYPAFFYLLLLPLTWVSPLVAKIVFAVIASGGICLFGRELRLGLSPAVTTSLLFLFPPLAISVFGGQNTGITLGLIALVVWYLRSNSSRNAIWCGIVLALLCYKPQFGAALFVPFVVWREWKVLASAVATGIGLLLLPMSQAGSAWVFAWLGAVRNFAPENFQVNSTKMISPMAALESVLGVGVGAHSIGLLVTALLFILAIWRCIVQCQREERVAGFLAFAAITAILSPQALFYDLGLATSLMLGSSQTVGDRRIWRYFFLCAVGLVIFLTLDSVTFPFYFLLALIMVLYSGEVTRCQTAT